jgi:hypothetical protein
MQVVQLPQELLVGQLDSGLFVSFPARSLQQINIGGLAPPAG